MSDSFNQVLRGSDRKKSRQGRYLLAHRDEVIKELSQKIADGSFRISGYREREIIEAGKKNEWRIRWDVQTRKSFHRGIGHARSIEEAEMFVKINNHISELRPIRISQLGEGKNVSNPKDIANLQKKRDRGVTAYHIYEFEFGGDTWVIKTEIYKNRSEAVYALYKKE